MSGSGRKRVSKWDAKQEDTQNGDDYVEKSGSYYHDKDPGGFYPEANGRNGSRRSVPDDDDDSEHLKSRKHPGEAWPARSRVSHEEGDASMMSYYDTRKSSEQDESRQPYWDRPRTRRSGSRSNSRSMSRSRSRSRSPLQRVRRDAGGSYDRHKTRARVSPRSGRDIDGRNSRAGDYDWEPKNRDTRDSKYYTEDSREQYPLRRSDYPEDHSNSRRETSDPILRSHRDRRDVPEREYNRISNVPCRYFAVGNCRNGTSCRFSHHVAPPARRSLERKPQDQLFSRHDTSGTTERMRNSHRWNERSDTGKSTEGAKGSSNGSWIGDMEMSPDWNYGVKTVKKPLNEEHGVIKETLAPAYEHGSASTSQRIGMFPTVGEKTVASSHHGFSNNTANTAPPVQAFNQNIENHSAVPYQSIPLAVGGSQVMLPPAATTTHLPGGLNENGIAQSTVSREELNHISNISASLAQFFGNGQPIPQLQSTLNPNQAMQLPEVYGKEVQPSLAQSDLLSNNSIQTGVVPAVTTLQINNSDSLVSLAGNPKASSEEKKTDEEANKELDVRKTEQEDKEAVEDAENVVEEEEEDDGEGDEGNKKEKDPKGMKAFKFALVEIVKELLKPAWKEGGMNKDAYKNIVKKAVDKVTGAIQTGSIPQTQEKIDQYLSASKPKLTKLVQAYISKVKKS